MPFIELDPSICAQAIEGYQNELEPERRKLDSFYRQFACTRCQSPCRKEQHASHLFADPDVLVPRSLLRCLACRCLFDPHSGLVLERGENDQRAVYIAPEPR